ncbi:unnamed protein product [Acanthoscelides obtectus]|uniref:C2H2-type domain-containing protein n=1 Tax=Acanthoscelides obtectus TaxID=200917 RepID=A0A9P0QJP9_ACAOB|nr:unnamed protein product [Acanthoscelides obtectus]CAK1686642.1 hypothetical protein AOBTE_LOCUS36012 [Acanthoscelides obtectus]
MADPAKKRSNPATSRGGESHTRGAKAPRLATRDGPTEGRGGKPRSPPAGGNKTASGPLAAGTSKAGPSNLSPKTGASDAANLGPAKQTRYNCEDCGKAFYTQEWTYKTQTRVWHRRADQMPVLRVGVFIFYWRATA